MACERVLIGGHKHGRTERRQGITLSNYLCNFKELGRTSSASRDLLAASPLEAARQSELRANYTRLDHHG